MASLQRVCLLVFAALLVATSFSCASAFAFARPHAGSHGRKFLLRPTNTFSSRILATQEKTNNIDADYSPPGPNPPIHVNPPAQFSAAKFPHDLSDYGPLCGRHSKVPCPPPPPTPVHHHHHGDGVEVFLSPTNAWEELVPASHGKTVNHESSHDGPPCGVFGEDPQHCKHPPSFCAPGSLCAQIPNHIDRGNKGFNRGGSVLPSWRL